MVHKIKNCNYKNIQKFMTKIRNIKSEIEDLEIIIDEAIIIQVINALDFLSA